MKVSVDGVRRNLASTYNAAVLAFNDMTDLEGCDSDYKEDLNDLRKVLIEMRQHLAFLMCTYSDNPEDLFTDMSDEADNLLQLAGGPT